MYGLLPNLLYSLLFSGSAHTGTTIKSYFFAIAVNIFKSYLILSRVSVYSLLNILSIDQLTPTANLEVSAV